MKKFTLTLIACLAFTSFTHAATSALTESLLEYETLLTAIGTDPAFQNVIGPSEFIVDVQRATRRVDVLGEVKYEILTREPSEGHHRHRRTNLYIAVLNVAANPGIGPNIITVVSITPVNQHHHSCH